MVHYNLSFYLASYLTVSTVTNRYSILFRHTLMVSTVANRSSTLLSSYQHDQVVHVLMVIPNRFLHLRFSFSYCGLCSPLKSFVRICVTCYAVLESILRVIAGLILATQFSPIIDPPYFIVLLREY